jgi:hypothetical protein
MSCWVAGLVSTVQVGTLMRVMDAAHTIRAAVARVNAIHKDATTNPDLQAALRAVKAFQAERFAGTYVDLLASPQYGAAARFFLEDLYSDKDYSQRDAQFSRIAGALQRIFPQQVVATAVALAELHLLTEELDWQMASKWLLYATTLRKRDVELYIACWRSVGRSVDRLRQLNMVLTVGKDLDRLTRTPGLRLMLRMMRGPARAGGMGSLQSFLESGFDTFANMSGNGSSAAAFLDVIRTRESSWINRLSVGDATECETDLRECLSAIR